MITKKRGEVTRYPAQGWAVSRSPFLLEKAKSVPFRVGLQQYLLYHPLQRGRVSQRLQASVLLTGFGSARF